MSSKVIERFPAGGAVAVDDLVTALRAAPAGGPLTVGDERVVDFLVAFARRLLRPAVARRHPELASLGFFLRRGEIAKALHRVADEPGQLRFPRGLVFHVPPANVDTIFVYSWALSALAGNANVVRISSRSAGAADVVLDALNDTLADAAEAVRQSQRMITYGRDDAVTAALSAAADLRVVWGGDRSVTEIRRHPLAPHARDLTFPDRSSFTVIGAAGWLTANERDRAAAALGFYNDSYWFDQAACASPRTVYWVGDPATAEAARADLLARLRTVLNDKRPEVDAAMAVEKRVATYGLAVEGAATAIHFDGNDLATVDLAEPGAIPRRWLGIGTFPQARVEALVDLAPVVVRRDQTVTHFGFSSAELVAFARALGGRGVDRIVPVGDALNFAATWDGYDLMREFTRITSVVTR
ncbi:Acyl-CoA reductase (LuxC) [Micromonospora sp. MW-13]|uniref:acyl-CoA reductase n=1 Tax=unclassified Micromonospora TaxID=2617518 RepID=UPI000ECCC8C5|nr:MULTISPECIES: acyl-CoA reductase [unclassified Micromonospora]MCX4473414.1 gamma-glutamyl phosphate reductase [Micromonospora sp. NBC_01655]RGC67454.1 Acyl-CoA reductase (LuxC) [Micromonospora sp. MW-13]